MQNGKLDTNSALWNLLSATSIDDMNYIYRGEFSQDIAHYLLLLAERNIQRNQLKGRIKKRVFHIMVESVQNITRHQDTIEDINEQKAIFAIQKFKSIFLVTTGNLVKNNKITILKEKLETINSMNEQELDSFYKEILLEGEFTAKGGAGLGLIEIARKSGNKLYYDFKPINDEYSFFYMHTFINTSDEHVYIPPIYSFDFIKKIHPELEKEHILLVYCSVFDQPSLISLISVLSSQIKGGLSFRKKVVTVLVEMLQNIMHHGYIRDDNKGKGALGMFYISNKDDRFSLNTINYVKNEKIHNLQERLNFINNLPLDKIEEQYNKQLVNFEDGDGNLGGLGFLEMRLKSKLPLKYEFIRINEMISYFSLRVEFAFEESNI